MLNNVKNMNKLNQGHFKGLTVIIPAYNEAESVGDTIRSLQEQTMVPSEIIVVDDCSNDSTSSVACSFGVTIVRPSQNTGSKAGAQNFALPRVKTEFVMAIDADTTLGVNAIENLRTAFEDPEVAAACGFVIPRYVRTLWERGRYVEYLFAFTFYKQVQDYYEKPLISSGCFSMYRTKVLQAHGGWSTRTLAEDMDLTWSFYQIGYKVRFIPQAVSYPIEPHNYKFISKQLRRWSHGFVQNVKLHWKGLLEIPYLRSAVAVATWDAAIASFVFLFVLPALAIILRNPLFFIGYVIDVPALLVPLLVGALPRKEFGKALLSLPAFFVLRTVNAFFFLKAVWSECVQCRSFMVYEKGH
ncbi:glycosyltransferase [candidate division KSB1 bacterium]|nr:glycosyltransferase [candidate division KSB1 bacterium]NIU26679.1 glycosyltransferase [candidate division KSB1 bacterium]NIU91627.1 glycosyltransferase [candidate division KSB1 bacterium]NIV94058.1 glycosyltransferase [candidate division KSB1 bacterium]NIW20559.1 glycosyltransferase [candidate division KSB1 bacterium]